MTPTPAPIHSAELERQLEYWRHTLARPQPLDLPLDFPRPPIFTHRGACHELRLEAPTARRLRQLCREEDATLFMGLLAGLMATLQRITGQAQINIGTQVAGLAGNWLVLRADVDETSGFRTLLADLRRRTREAFANQAAPFEKLVDALEKDHDRSRHPLFQVALTLLEGALEQRAPNEEKSRFDLDFYFAEEGEELAGTLIYCRDLFAAPSIARLARAFSSLLEAATERPAAPIARLPLLDAAERRRLAAGHGSTPLAYPRDLLLHETFFAQAAKTPRAFALAAGEVQQTYEETASLACRIAQALREVGVGPEVRVGVFLERSHLLVTSLIGVLAAEGAYVPLDPDYPAERIGYTLEDAEAQVIVTERALEDKLPETSSRILLLEDLEARRDLPSTRPRRLACQQNLAYLIYTSGSTGRPKGVAITHQSVIAFLEWTKHVFSDDEMACVLFSTSICFDISIFEMFATLQRGGKVVVAKNAFELPRLACRDELTLIDTVPSVARELLREGALPPKVVTLNLAGEALPQDLVDRAWQEPGLKKVYNFYGPSEDTTFSTFEMCEKGLPPTIGHLIEGARGYVVDRNLELLPLGVPGELYIAGAGLSRGYLGKARLTAERYLPDPFSEEPGERMYRTGDLIRHREDGGFHFAGRIDHQVKIRGFRVELGEIEIVLRNHPGVAQAVVVARSDGPAGQRLVAYVVPHPAAEVDGEEVRAFLAARLPPFMVPQATVLLGSFPLTPNGKVDRKTLPAPEALGADRHAYRAPQTAAEKALGAIWEELLGRERIGLDDDFFALGGDSILAIQAVSRAHAAGWDFEPRELFLHPTLAGAAAIARPVDAAAEDVYESELDADELDDVLADLEGIV